MSGAGNNNTTPIEDDPNSCIPGPLRDFVFDLYQCTRNASNADEQAVLYKETFRDLSSKVNETQKNICLRVYISNFLSKTL